MFSTELSNQTLSNVYIKREDTQKNKSFKCRGAINNIMEKIISNQNVSELVCASTGNHAQGFAMACSNFEISGIVFVPKCTPEVKIQNTKKFGTKNGFEYVKIKITGDTFDDALNDAKKYLNNSQNTCFIHPYDDIKTIEGQRTIMQEIIFDMNGKNPDYIFVPVGGGGLLAGIIQEINARNLQTKIICCQSEFCSVLKQSFVCDKNTEIEIKNCCNTVAEATVVKQIGFEPWNIIKNFQDIDCISLNEKEILYAMGMINTLHGIKSEGSAALAIAGFMKYSKNYDIKNKNIVIVNSGGNVTESLLENAREVFNNKENCLF